MDLEGWACNLSKITTVFCSLDFDVSKLHKDSSESLGKLNQAVMCIQRCLYQCRGNLNKFLMDDKGTTMIFVFGVIIFNLKQNRFTRSAMLTTQSELSVPVALSDASLRSLISNRSSGLQPVMFLQVLLGPPAAGVSFRS
jgi:hypothetical protein